MGRGGLSGASRLSGDERAHDKPGKKQEGELWKCLGVAPLCTEDCSFRWAPPTSNGIIAFAVRESSYRSDRGRKIIVAKEIQYYRETCKNDTESRPLCWKQGRCAG